MNSTEPSPATRFRYAGGVRPVAADGDVRLETPRGPATFRDLSPAQSQALDLLRDGATEADLTRILQDAEGATGATWAVYTLNRLVQLGLVDLHLVDEAGAPLLQVLVIGRDYKRVERPLPPAPFHLSRFAWIRQDAGQVVLESPRSMTQVRFADWRGPAIAGLLAAGVTADALPALPGVTPATVQAVTSALFQAGFLEPVELPAAARQDPVALALDQWEFHDLLFHSRSRQGRHRNPYGGNYRYEGAREPEPAVKSVDWPRSVSLPKPDIRILREADPPFAQVLEARRSLRTPGDDPLTLEQLGEFLYRTARVRGRTRTEHEEVSNRPYPGGGADYELEIYPLVHRVAELEQGLYYFHPLDHALHLVTAPSGVTTALLRDSAQKAPPGHLPDVLFCITSRFQRLTYKYQSIPYAVTLKDLGVLYQTFYLAATAMGLAPSALGGGDSDLFAAASGVPYFVEPQVGEFMLSTRNPVEGGEFQFPS